MQVEWSWVLIREHFLNQGSLKTIFKEDVKDIKIGFKYLLYLLWNYLTPGNII